MQQPPSLYLVAGIGVAVAAVVSLTYPFALRVSQALWDLINRHHGPAVPAGANDEEWHPVGAASRH